MVSPSLPSASWPSKPTSYTDKALTGAQPGVVADVLLQWIYDRVGGSRRIPVVYFHFFPFLGFSEFQRFETLVDRNYIKHNFKLLNQQIQLNNQLLDNYRFEREMLRKYPKTNFPPLAPILNTSPPPPMVELTVTGADIVEKSGLRWADRVLRNHSARDRLLAWVYDQACQGSNPVYIQGFLQDPQSIIEGHFIPAEDAGAAAMYLWSRILWRF